MARYVVFWGHGRWSPNENPGKTQVPTGCRLLLFARHKEMIDVRRMHNIIECLERADGSDDKFMYWTRLTASLRRVKGPGEEVHNYRLYPYDEHMGTYPSVEGFYEVVTTPTVKPDGESLAQLMERHGKPGVTMLWVPCRQVIGLDPAHALVDAYQSKDQQGKLLRDGMGYYRPADYFRHRLHGICIPPLLQAPEERVFQPGRVHGARKPRQ